MDIKTSIKLSAVIGKIGVKINNPNGTQMEVGADLMVQVVGGLHKAENEVYEFIASFKGVPIEEAPSMDVMQIINEVKAIPGIKSFFTSALK